MTPFRILVADDERLVLEGYRIVLEDLMRDAPPLADLEAALFGGAETSGRHLPKGAIEVTCLTQGNAAVEAFRRAKEEGKPYGGVLLDFRMPPGMSGLEAAQAIRAIDPGVNIALVSGFSDIDMVDLGRTVPPAEQVFFLQKPFQAYALQRLVQAFRESWQSGGPAVVRRMDLGGEG